jgi:hypothetical protein
MDAALFGSALKVLQRDSLREGCLAEATNGVS